MANRSISAFSRASSGSLLVGAQEVGLQSHCQFRRLSYAAPFGAAIATATELHEGGLLEQRGVGPADTSGKVGRHKCLRYLQDAKSQRRRQEAPATEVKYCFAGTAVTSLASGPSKHVAQPLFHACAFWLTPIALY